MEAILDLLEKPPKKPEPVVCLDERPVQLHAEVRTPIPGAPGRIRKRDGEYRRCGTANVFAIVAPRTGDHLTIATANRKGAEFARMMNRISRRYHRSRKIHIIMDNLNTHCKKSLTDYYGKRHGSKLWNRFRVYYTPKHGSWLNPAEIEISLVSRECLGRDRISELGDLKGRVRAWTLRADRKGRSIDWRFTSRQARKTFGYKTRGRTLKN